VSSIDFHNSTHLANDRLLEMCEEGLQGWSVGRITLRVRYSRGADFSGTCFYADKRVFINIGRHLRYPYRMDTNLAKVKLVDQRWRRLIYAIDLRNGYELAAFIFMHELYHLLVKRARRNTRQKESMCDRFAARHLVDRYGVMVRDHQGRRVARELWDFQDLEGFVAAARDPDYRGRVIQPVLKSASRPRSREQLLLFPDLQSEYAR
jgi:hypothetical protein